VQVAAEYVGVRVAGGRCALLGINVIDHVIVTGEGRYRSLADEGVLGGAR